MALIECYDWKKEISDQAPACLHCGAPKEAQPPQIEVAEIPESVAVVDEPEPITPMNQYHERALALLRQSLDRSHAQFHEHQWESISTLMEDRGRLLVVQRTGWGKSAVYFIATRLMRDQGYGLTVIISPLLALMRNQIEAAASYGVRLGTINSGSY